MATFPKRDRGIIESDDEKCPELDPIDAAALKAKIKQKHIKKTRAERGEAIKKVRFAGDDDQEGEELSDDSDEIVYDSEEEAEIEQEEFLRKFQQQQAVKSESKEAKPDVGYDINKELASMQNFKAAAGVKFTRYDELGLPDTEEAKELRKHIKTDDAPDAIVIEAPPEQMEKILRPTGLRVDYDKPVE